MDPPPPGHGLLLTTGAMQLPPSHHACGYLPGRVASDDAYLAFRLPPLLYKELMDRNFRRAGQVVYRPRCAGCARCVQIRVPVATFRASRSQRRCARRNEDLRLSIARPRLTDEKVLLYRRYLAHQHPGTVQSADRSSLREFLYASCVETREIEYRDPTDRLLGVSIIDVCDQSLSSVYHFFEPADERRGLGTFSALAEIELCRRNRIPYYYLGYWVEGCRSMEYKARFRPCEILVDGGWRAMDRAESESAGQLTPRRSTS